MIENTGAPSLAHSPKKRKQLFLSSFSFLPPPPSLPPSSLLPPHSSLLPLPSSLLPPPFSLLTVLPPCSLLSSFLPPPSSLLRLAGRHWRGGGAPGDAGTKQSLKCCMAHSRRIGNSNKNQACGPGTSCLSRRIAATHSLSGGLASFFYVVFWVFFRV